MGFFLDLSKSVRAAVSGAADGMMDYFRVTHAARVGRLRAVANDAALRPDRRGDALMSLAYLHVETSDTVYVQRYFDLARDQYMEAVQLNDPPPPGGAGPSARTKIGILYFAPLYGDHDFAMAYEFFWNAHTNGCPHATYWLGRACLIGFGTDQDARAGFDLIQQAAARGVLRAKFEVALLLEGGFEGEPGRVVRKNTVLAGEYYRSIAITARQPSDDEEWDWEYSIRNIFNNDDLLSKEDAMGLQLGSLLSWEFAGQAFLFGAAAAFSTGTSQYYEKLRILGMSIGILSLCSSLSGFLKSFFRRRDLQKMFAAKVRACKRLVPQPLHRPWSHYARVQAIRFQFFLAYAGDGAAVALSALFVWAWATL
jgi:TPR repeat protein